MARTESDRMITKDIKNMTIAEYMEYEAEMKRHPRGYAQSYTRSLRSTTLGRNAEMGKRITGQDKEEEEDALIDILKIVVEECKTIYKNAQIKAPSSRTSKIQGVSFVTEAKEGDSIETLPCQLPPREMNPGSFTLPCTIGNLKLYVMADLGASVNVMPKSLFKHLKLADLMETSMVVEMVDMTKKALLGIVDDILVKIDKFMFHSDFVVIDMLEGPNETMLLGKPFLATIHAQIDVFRREILLGIGEEKVKFDMNGGICHSRVPFKKIYMASSVQESEYFNPLEIETDVFPYDSPTCLLFEQSTHPCSDVSINTVDLSDDMQELEGSQKDEVGSHLLENVVSRWHVCKPVRITRKVECSSNGYVFEIMKDKMLEEIGVIFADFLNPSNDTLRIITYFPNVKKPRLRDNSFEEWVKIKLGHTNINEAIKCEIFKEWVKENFNFEVDFGKTRDDPYSRRFDVYKEKFDSEIEQLANEYDLRVGFEEEEQWESGIEKPCYTPPFVKSETFEVKRYSFKNKKSFVRITKQLDDAQPLGRVNGSRFMGMIRKEGELLGKHKVLSIMKWNLRSPRLVFMWYKGFVLA
ncbi:phospholipase-like protein [Tanacetum coccineum]